MPHIADFFLATPAGVMAAFRGWLPPQSEPVLVQLPDLLSGASRTALRYSGRPAGSGSVQSSDLSGFPVFEMRGVTLEHVFRRLTRRAPTLEEDAELTRPFVVGPRDCEEEVHEVPLFLLEALSSADLTQREEDDGLLQLQIFAAKATNDERLYVSYLAD